MIRKTSTKRYGSGHRISSELALKISPAFKPVRDQLKRFDLESFHNSTKVDEYVKIFSIKALCKQLSLDSGSNQAGELYRAVSPQETKPFEPEYDDLCRIHWIALTRKCLTVLEFGSGFSTVVLADAMRILHAHFSEWSAKNIRVDRPYHVYSVEEDHRFADITRARLAPSLAAFSTVSESSVEMLLHDNRMATVYSSLPNVSPDFIYLDGPSQFATDQSVNGISFNNKVRMPISADVMRMEFFLEPGTLVLVDGRTTNIRFLKSYLRRDWVYLSDPDGDIHYLELQEPPLGHFNALKLKFCLNQRWLLKS